jgi:hypothetical protein
VIAAEGARDEIRDEMAERDEIRDETVPRDQIPYRRAMEHLQDRLRDATRGNFDPDADITPIRALIVQGCDLDADVVPVVARLVPELPRRLKRWDGPVLPR